MTVESSSNVWKSSIPGRACAVLGFLLALFTAACGGVPKTYFYTLQAPAAPAASDPRTTYVLGVEHFRAPEMLRDDRMVYYVSPTQMNFYQYNRWGSAPATMLSEYTAQWVESTGVFAQVKTLPVRDRVDYILGGRVDNFEEVDEAAGVKVRVAVELSLVRASDHKLVWSDQRRQEAPVTEHGAGGVASALNAVSAQVVRDLVPGLVAQVEQDFKGNNK